jgi:phage I-like protein
MNLTTTFEPAPDGWFHIAPHGTFPHPNGALQVIDAEACDAMQRTFQEEAKGPNFPGLLVDFDHFSHDPAQPSTAAGWLTALEHRDDGLYAQVRWSDLGHQALKGGRYRLVSPVWNRADCDTWTAPAGSEAKQTAHIRPRRLDRLALTNDPNLPGLAPLTNRREEPATPSASANRAPLSETTMSLRHEILQALRLHGTSSDGEIATALRSQREELETLRNHCSQLVETQVDAELDRFADVITNRDVVRAQLLANRESTLAVLGALRQPEPYVPLHQPRAHRPNLHLLGPATSETDPASARRVANRARQLQSQLKIGHHAAFRMAEGEAEDAVA